MGEKKKFLIIRLSAIGDIIHALPVAYVIKQKYKDAQIDWVVGDKFEQLIKNNPLIDNCYVANLSEWKKNWLSPKTVNEIIKLNKTLQKEEYDYSLDLHGMFKSLIIQRFCGAKKRIGYKDYREFAPFGSNILIEPKAKRPYINYHIITRHLDLLTESGIISKEELDKMQIKAELPPPKDETKEKIKNLLSSINPDKKTVIFAPATTWDNKHWDKDYWRELYKMLKEEANIVFSGVKADLDLINYIREDDNNSLVLAGKTNLEEYIELLRHADILISPDSSAAHIAWAQKVPHIFAIFCATSKNTFAPLGHRAFPIDEPICKPCNKKRGCKNHICTKQTSPTALYDEIKKHLV